MMIEPVLEIFGGWRGDVSRLRRVILEEFVKSDCEGMIFTQTSHNLLRCKGL